MPFVVDHQTDTVSFTMKLDPDCGSIMGKSSLQHFGWFAESKVRIYKNSRDYFDGIVQNEYLFACHIEKMWQRECSTIEWDSDGKGAENKKEYVEKFGGSEHCRMVNIIGTD